MSDLAKTIRTAFAELIGDVHVCMPARITAYDADKMTCSAVPLIKRRFYKRTEAEEYPEINNVPVVFARTSTALIRLPVTVGDIVTLIFADHEISNWVNSDGRANEYIDKRYHNINDCFAFVGGYPTGKAHAAVNPDALEIIVKTGTKITIGNEDDDLIDIAHNAFTELKTLTEKLSDTLANIQLITVTGNLGAPTSTPLNAASFVATKTQVDAVTTAVDAQLTKLGNIKV